ncbi:hypothetical protein G195_001661 [Phytophthora kernoviae 00238/432]|uniref:E3 ubiquitin-protein ligase n=1 Tax=Phytophthora kernoviae 00238/432 TaxID=1284355 RepID=A0A8J4WAY4_9STRA|nr:hypothetical protein G195_001661 [Phytophthora kernoviae 00238/432]
MVAIRGKKTKASAKPKAVEKTSKSAKVASKDADVDQQTRVEQQQKLNQRREEELLALVRFALQSALARGEAISTLAPGQTVATVCNALLTILCGSGKERQVAPTQILGKLTRTARKRVCGAIFSADEIAYSCRNCQLDTTCVMCKDCFTRSDHAGHDVYFQRTTAGSSCDCGDLHAWKRSGFCTKHQGTEMSEGAKKKYKLPKQIGVVAPVVIDTVVEHVYQVMLGVDYGFELADAFELFTRDQGDLHDQRHSWQAISLSSSYRRHESVRKSFEAVVHKYFTSDQATATDDASSMTSALTLLVRYDCTLRKKAVEHSHSLLREHLLDIQFRSGMLEAYLRSYASMTNMFLRGLGNSSESIFDFAVQFLTVPHLVQNYTKKETAKHLGRLELVHELLSALKTVFQSAVDDKDGVLNADHPALSSQKYKHCIENLEYIFNIGTLSSELVCNEDNLKIWLSCLNILQGGDPQVRRGIHQNHVEYESDSWLSMFNLGIRVHSVFAISCNGFNPSQVELAKLGVAEIFRPIIDTTISSSARLNEKMTKKTLVPVSKLVTGNRPDVDSEEPLEQGIDGQQCLQMLEEFLRLVIVLGTSLPSSTGATYENEFLMEEMLQQLCAKPLSFSKLFDLAILPSGQDDITTARLEGVLAKVSDFVPPSGLEPGRYDLKDGLLESYNPYFLHLNLAVVQLILWKKKAEASPSESSGAKAQNSSSLPMTLEQRKMEARKRAMAAMAKRQAAFQAMVDLADKDQKDKVDDETEGEHSASTSLGKRKAGTAEEPDKETKKHQKLENEQCYNCILCHDSSAQGQMGMAAYVHQSTVLAPGFRPDPHEALGAEGKKVRSQVKEVIEKMELCSGGSLSTSDAMNSPSPTLRAFATSFPDWYMDTPLDDQITRENTAQNSPRSPTGRRPRHDRIRFGNGRIPMLEGELLQTDEELEVLEGVLDLREDQQLFPMGMRGAVNIDRVDRGGQRRLGGREGAGTRGANAHGRGGPMYDSDDDGYDDASPRFHLERMPPGLGRSSHESAKLYLTPCGLHVRTCQHAVHIHCLERYITSLHDKAMRGEEFDGVQAIDPDSAMTQFLCPLCKTLSNFLIPTSEPRVSISKENKLEQKRSVVSGSSGEQEEKVPTWDGIVGEQLAMPGWHRSVLGRDGGFEGDDGDSEHDLWRDYFEETLWEPHGSLEKGAPFLWSACAFTLASFLTVAEDEYRNVSGSNVPFDPLKDLCPPSLEKEFESLTAVTKFCRWTFSLLEHSADAKVISETAKRCCPINTETKREYRKFTKVLGSIDACLRGTILGLLVADTFTVRLIELNVIADELDTIWRFIPVFTAADLLQRLHTEFFEPTKIEGTSLFQDSAGFVRRMKLFWRCLVDQEGATAMHIPTLIDIASSSDATFEQIWSWCMDRMLSKTHLGSSKDGDKCEHTEGCSEAYVASMFILREVPTRPQLIDLPIQYDELYSEMAGRKCTRCDKSPCDPGLCLICGEYLCCGDSCCTRPFMPHGPPVGECTRHAAECGGGVGIVLLLEQCRIAVVGGSMAAYFPCPYVDAHGEEDIGLQRGRPLRLDMARYRYLESLWLSHRIFTEVSRQRNQRDPQYTINLSYL